ncbi:glutamate synthase subunit beta [Actinotalea fermentans]|uniref:Dihydropyrimidine dehydrogenase subunit A n=1 Tax=Actinotalea fermentans TaxID=43671 RepID=A0A511YV33_9CELL|nr:glutamate synthase subunit beta [Actinotalea fermentans]KGM16850.1 glutamate synthase [Actinotalea fermentans ATCC 43279 = JCM 9966 = DSM 3133]GEN79065.1 dihydropyrimidine dehydrogenase subunit A [Actinotalea fermentans]
MADPRGFLKVRQREVVPSRPVPVRLMDWKEVHEHLEQDDSAALLHRQAGRCMDCGVPFCHSGCPLGNLIPEWNDLVWKGQWAEASDRLHATNNFPEVTGRICPAPCESSCVLGINQPPVTIKQVEHAIADESFARDLVTPQLPYFLTGYTVAVVGSGPAGLAAAQQLTRAGHTVAVFERDDRIGGLLRYGVPDFKLEKHLLDRRIAQMEAEGTRFRPGVEIGKDITYRELTARYDAVVLATGSRIPRGLDIPGSDLSGIHFAMPYLTQANRVVAGDEVPDQILATGKHVVVIGGGDTGSDCVGTALRQGAASVTSLDIGAQPPTERPLNEPWPVDARLFKISSSHEEGGSRTYLATTQEFLGADGRVTGLRVATTEYTSDGARVPGETIQDIPADLVILAMGFTGPETDVLAEQTGADVTGRGLVARGDDYSTSVPGVFVAGDAGRGQSLVVWAISEGRAVAAAVDAYLRSSGDPTMAQAGVAPRRGSELPAPVTPTTRPMRP